MRTTEYYIQRSLSIAFMSVSKMSAFNTKFTSPNTWYFAYVREVWNKLEHSFFIPIFYVNVCIVLSLTSQSELFKPLLKGNELNFFWTGFQRLKFLQIARNFWTRSFPQSSPDATSFGPHFGRNRRFKKRYWGVLNSDSKYGVSFGKPFICNEIASIW